MTWVGFEPGNFSMQHQYYNHYTILSLTRRKTQRQALYTKLAFFNWLAFGTKPFYYLATKFDGSNYSPIGTKAFYHWSTKMAGNGTMYYLPNGY